jgi:hypothetical protein
VSTDRSASPVLAVASRSPGDVHGAREALAEWLLGGGAQLTSGTHRGAVAGWLDQRGRASYVYPEITGYYLQWLSWRARTCGGAPTLSGRAAAAQRWLARWVVSPDLPPTRVYLDAATEDWRNAALFFFDVAMVVRGLAWAAASDLIHPDPALVATLSSLLARMIGSDGLFMAVLSRDGASSPPDRWSTRRGPFFTKAAQGIMFAGRHLPGLSCDVVKAADATFEASLQWMWQRPHREIHPLLYSMEGLLNESGRLDEPQAMSRMEKQYCSLIGLADDSGHLPETVGAEGMNRLDVVAQALRVGIGLQPWLRPAQQHKPILETMCRLLVRSTTSAGEIPFAPTGSSIQLSVWTAMFAEQALTMWQSHPDDAACLPALECLV